jgi:hypothetical protein
VLHRLSCPPPTGSTKQSSWSTRHNLLHQLTRLACRICFINATLEAVLLKQCHERTRPMPPAIASTALDLLHQQLCPPHRISEEASRAQTMGGILWGTWARYGCPLLCARFKLFGGKPGRAIYEKKKIEFVELLFKFELYVPY